LTPQGEIGYTDIVSGNEFLKLRKQMGLSQEELSREIDVSERGIRRWERSETPIPKIAELAMKYIVEKARGRKKR
jgi:transcriptional regulator with XRE-family HTH domain